MHQFIDLHCKSIAEFLSKSPKFITQFEKGLRTGSGKVVHLMREEIFGKAYLLIRLFTYLLYFYWKNNSTKNSFVQYTLYSGVHVSGIPSSTSQFEVSKNNADDNVDYWLQSKLTGAKWQMTLHRIAVRYGVEPDLIFGRQVITLSVEAANDRIAMAAIPLSFVCWTVDLVFNFIGLYTSSWLSYFHYTKAVYSSGFGV